MIRYIVLGLIVLQMATVIYAHNATQYARAVEYKLAQEAKARADGVEAVRRDMEHLTDPRTVQERMINWILREGEFGE